MADRLAYVSRLFPNERAHPGAEFVSRAVEAAAKQDRFWQVHDLIYEEEPPITEAKVRDFARKLGLDMDRLARHPGQRHAEACSGGCPGRQAQRRHWNADRVRRRHPLRWRVGLLLDVGSPSA